MICQFPFRTSATSSADTGTDHLSLFALVGFSAFAVRVATNANRLRRVVAWLPNEMATKVATYLNLPELVQDDKTKNALHQLNQALVAIQRGGLTGVGFNKSMQKQYYLPEAHTDFIFAIGAEEWGLIFSLVLLTLFVIFFVCGMRIALHAPDRLGRFFAFGRDRRRHGHAAHEGAGAAVHQLRGHESRHCAGGRGTAVQCRTANRFLAAAPAPLPHPRLTLPWRILSKYAT